MSQSLSRHFPVRVRIRGMDLPHRVTLGVMKRVLRGAVVVALAAPITVCLAVTQPGVADACTCAYYGDGSQAEEQIADFATVNGAVFVGTPTAQREDNYTVYYDFDVSEVFRGDVGPSTTVSTADNSAACGTGFDFSSEYLVFATTYDTQGAPWSVNMCSATTSSSNEATRSATIAQFGEPSRPAQAEDDDSRTVPVLVGAGAIAALAAVATAWVLRRRSR